MDAEKNCSELARFPRLLNLDKPLPKEFLKHVRQCENCLFWVSRVLAIFHAVQGTFNRLIRDDECPSDNVIAALLLKRIALARIGNQESEVDNFLPAIQELSDELRGAEEHVSGETPESCPYCSMHFINMINFSEKLQKRYETRILEEEEIRPIALDQPRAILAERFSYNSEKKPN